MQPESLNFFFYENNQLASPICHAPGATPGAAFADVGSASGSPLFEAGIRSQRRPSTNAESAILCLPKKVALWKRINAAAPRDMAIVKLHDLSKPAGTIGKDFRQRPSECCGRLIGERRE
ncbi:hypothetical protein [Burkholderia sp. 22PA0106]|uniref:hypothetical protein n=1 Tax=Burkholderia sp. 22PA0106 TaxID=3237371 RepID=UPI0039C45762